VIESASSTASIDQRLHLLRAEISGMAMSPSPSAVHARASPDSADRIEPALRAAVRAEGFAVSDTHVELFGLCEKCQPRSVRKS
jgi:hypothetical protein